MIIQSSTMCDGRCMRPCRTGQCSNHHEDFVHKFCKIKECKCKLVSCKNVTHCNAAFPSYFYKESNGFITNGTCNECALFDVTFLNEKKECLICAQLLYMVKTKCNHEMCLDCVINIEGKDANCPFCRKVIEQPLY